MIERLWTRFSSRPFLAAYLWPLTFGVSRWLDAGLRLQVPVERKANIVNIILLAAYSHQKSPESPSQADLNDETMRRMN